MRTSASSIALMLALTWTLAGQAPGARAQTAAHALDGKWGLVVLAFGEDKFLTLDVTPGADGKPSASIAEANLPEAKLSRFQAEGDRIDLAVRSEKAGLEIQFHGMAPEGKDDRFLGVLTIRGTAYPARLAKGETSKRASPLTSPVNELRALQPKAPKARVEGLKALIAKDPEAPSNQLAYAALLESAADAGLTEAEVRALAEAWTASAKPYGPTWLAEVRSKALAALGGKKPYASLALAMARETSRSLGDEVPIDRRAEAARRVANFADAAGTPDPAADAEARALEAKADEAAKADALVLEPKPFTGNREATADRVVLLELFTGAQCPPCVAADVAFDALLETYKPTELVALEYHLHIPGPDPMTNADSEARSAYYGVRGTPSTYFNGSAEAPGGGFALEHAETKYQEYREAIEQRLEGRKRASIDLQVDRAGDKVQIRATAKADGGSKPRLRLALVEGAVRYVGGNKLRFHHHVVRALPGGAEGQPLEGGQAQADVTVDLEGLRTALGSEIDTFAQTRSFPGVLSPIRLEGLSVVAFVQDDADKSVWHARSAAVEPAK